MWYLPTEICVTGAPTSMSVVGALITLNLIVIHCYLSYLTARIDVSRSQTPAAHISTREQCARGVTAGCHLNCTAGDKINIT